MHFLFDLLFHLDSHLQAFVAQYGPWVYGLLFAIIFAETGFVVTPFLPGDSLLFTTGALAATSVLDIRIIAPLLVGAAIAGDTVNYAVGHFLGPRVFTADDRQSFWHRLMNRDHLNEAHAFYERNGGKAVVLGQFLPIIRTFVPFVAGCGAMTYRQFAFFNVTAAVLWVGICMGAGYAFGNFPQVKQHFELVIVGIVCISLIPFAWGVVSSRMRKAKSEPNERAD
jgi:membrane-associated protein